MKTKFFDWLLQLSDKNDLAQYIPIFARWLERIGYINGVWGQPELYRLFQQSGFHLVRNQPYAAADASKAEKPWAQPPYQVSYERIRKGNIEQEFRRLTRWFDELKHLPREGSTGFYWDNPMLPPLDALVLYAMMREYQPQRLLEIGSGFSTEIALMAANHTKTAIQCIDPELDSHLMARESQLQARIQKPVQEVDPEVFGELQAGDFLFIDTTHTVKLGSDVNHLIFNVLPRLASGVFVHFHDIFLPYEYPRRWYDEVSIFWNEQYLLLAYLLDNPSIELLLPNYALSHTFKDQLNAGLKEFNIWGLTENLGGGSGASFWLRKI